MSGEPTIQRGEMTQAQRDALTVLRRAGRFVRGGQRTHIVPVPSVHTGTGETLAALGLAERPDAYREDFLKYREFRITDAGRKVLDDPA